MTRRKLTGIGFVLFIIGMAAVESEWVWFPALCMATGGLLVHIGEGECSK
jgi:energy-converting hydrogenase Eha subunit G